MNVSGVSEDRQQGLNGCQDEQSFVKIWNFLAAKWWEKIFSLVIIEVLQFVQKF